MSTVQSQSVGEINETSGFKRLLASRPLISYFALAFVGTWLLDAPMVLGKDGLGIFHDGTFFIRSDRTCHPSNSFILGISTCQAISP
jgi:hypothetical protein